MRGFFTTSGGDIVVVQCGNVAPLQALPHTPPGPTGQLRKSEGGRGRGGGLEQIVGHYAKVEEGYGGWGGVLHNGRWQIWEHYPALS